MFISSKRTIIYIILSLAIIAILIITAKYIISIDKPFIQGLVECKTYTASSKIAGRIDSIFISEGDWVERGELLYTISTPELNNKLKQAEAMRIEAQALQKEVDRGARKQQIEATLSLVKKAQAGVTLAESTFERIARLYNKGIVPRQQYDEAKSNLEVMRANLLSAKAEYSLAIDGATSEEMQIVAAKLSEATLAVEEVNLYIGDGKVVAPASGRVSSITSNGGELISVGFPVVTILDLDDCWATFNIKESEMTMISYGKTLNAYVPALDTWAKFEVYYIANEADFATWAATRARGGFDIRTFEVRARCKDKNIEILPGMSVIIYEI